MDVSRDGSIQISALSDPYLFYLRAIAAEVAGCAS